MRAHRLVPRHEITRLEEEFPGGKVSLAQFATGLHEVTLAPCRDGRVLAEMQENITGCLRIRNHIDVHGRTSAPRQRALV